MKYKFRTMGRLLDGRRAVIFTNRPISEADIERAAEEKKRLFILNAKWLLEDIGIFIDPDGTPVVKYPEGSSNDIFYITEEDTKPFTDGTI